LNYKGLTHPESNTAVATELLKAFQSQISTRFGVLERNLLSASMNEGLTSWGKSHCMHHRLTSPA